MTNPSQQGARLAFSCVVDRNEAIERAVLIWAQSLIAMEGVDPGTIFIHTVEPDLEVLKTLESLGTRVIQIDRFGDGKHCNKLAQPLSPAKFDADLLIMSDCDIAFTGQFVDAFRREAAIALKSNPRTILGKTVDFCNPPLDHMVRIMQAFGVGKPEPLAYDTLTANPMPLGYFNGGMYGIPVPLLKELGQSWQNWATKLLESKKAIDILGEFAWHIDQISFYLALRELGVDAYNLDERYNFPIHVRHQASRQVSIEKPLAIHFHNNLDQDGLLGLSGVRVVDIEASRINDCLARRGLKIERGYESSKPFNSWRPIEKDFSMTTQNAASLRALLRAAGIERAETILDVRCGTGRHVEGLDIRGYRGFDTRSAEVGLASRRGINGKVIEGVPSAQERAEMVMCLDFAGFAGDVGGIRAAAMLLGEMARDRLLLLEEPRKGFGWLMGGGEEADVEEELRRSGKFLEILNLGTFAGRQAILALVKREKGMVPVRPSTSGVERLYAHLARASAPKRSNDVANAASEIEILKRLPDFMEGYKVAILSGGEPHGVFDTLLDLRGALRVKMEPLPPEPDGGAWETEKAVPLPLEEQYDVIAVLADVSPLEINARLARHLSRFARPGAVVFLALQTEKRAFAANLPGSDGVLSANDIEEVLRKNHLLPTTSRTVALPFDHATDVMMIEAIRVSSPKMRKKKRSRTPEFLRRIEHRVRAKIRGQQSRK